MGSAGRFLDTRARCFLRIHIVALALRVTGVEELVRRVEGGGFAVTSGIVEQVLPDGAILKVAVCCGPDNVTVILVEPPADRKSLAS